MSPITRPLLLAAALVGAPSAVAQGVPGQPMQMVPRATPDADALANAMRRLGANPRDLSALIEAGELSLKLGDVNAAAALFKRAEGVDPMNGRIKAGMARILVSQERPGEALRYFDQATGYGLDPRSFAGDRALAYDLIGQQERAQRDYRVALKDARSDEVARRYALSLAISGKRDQALAEIDDQVRRNDRSAWRARAFVLAMTGDVPGAEKIAGTMMPPGMGAALAPFFGRLAALSPIDRAFAVHFGELRASPQRLADARMAPPLPVLPPEAQPVQLAAANAKPEKVSAGEMRRRVREQAKQQRDLARAEAKARRAGGGKPPVVLASAPTDASGGLQPPRYGNGVTYAAPSAVVQALPTPASTQAPAPAPVVAQMVTTATPTPAPALTSTPVPTPMVAQASPTPAPVPTSVAARGAVATAPASTFARPDGAAGVTQAGTSAAVAVPGAPGNSVAGVAAQTSPVTRPMAGATVASVGSQTPSVTTAAGVPSGPVTAAASGGTVPQPGFSTVDPSPTLPASAASVAATPSSIGAAVPAAGVSSTPPALASASPPPTPTQMSEDSILARIMAGISIPAAELGVAPVREPAPVVAAAPAPAAAAGTSVATAESIAAGEAARRAAADERAAQHARAVEATKKAAEVAAAKIASPKQERNARLALAKAEKEPAEAIADKTASVKPDPRGKADSKGKTAKTDAAAEKAAKEPVDPKKLAADRKAAAAKKLADAKKLAEDKKAAAEAKLAKADPPRIWVQVAGGANESDLPKAWVATQGKAAALKGKAAYSTPLRATNRVVTGPFKTDAEARAFINTLAKQGVSAFPFTSEKGQKMKKLGEK